MGSEGMRQETTAAVRAAAVAATLAFGLAAAVPAAGAARITGHEQLRASVLKAAAAENTVCSAGYSTSVLGGWPPATPTLPPAAQA